ncbi:hypothetical protein [Qipengyuania sp.]|uniref:hypothetical protein n=1 Tax=Qipengyuania sp. TaxID=2004515 RepID=UPI0035C8008F
MPRPSPLDDSQTARFAWKRWRRLMAFMVVATVATLIAAFAYFHSLGEPVSIHFYIAVGLGITLMMMLTGALMGLVFLSNGTGHDDVVGED